MTDIKKPQAEAKKPFPKEGPEYRKALMELMIQGMRAENVALKKTPKRYNEDEGLLDDYEPHDFGDNPIDVPEKKGEEKK